MKVPDCPICRSPGTLNRRQETIYCSNARCAFCHFNLREEDWNNLCALVEKGREYDAKVTELVVKYDTLLTKLDEVESQYGEAVELLRGLLGFRDAARKTDDTKEIVNNGVLFARKLNEVDTYIVRIDKGGGK